MSPRFAPPQWSIEIGRDGLGRANVDVYFDSRMDLRGRVTLEVARQLVDSLIADDPAGPFLVDAAEALDQYAKSVKS